MNREQHFKVKEHHLQRNAYLYVRQSTLRQVVENTESTRRQYALEQRAVALGWPAERIIVIDSDLGQSGASAVDRAGFQRLVAEVGMGQAGLVLGLEVSRLARNSTDWHRLLEICALTDTLLLDEDGVYDPNLVNDRLLLGLKGTLSEAELFTLRARLRGGIWNKAQRGELALPLPVGLVYDAADRVTLDPDQQVQQSLQLLFETFRRTGSAFATVKAYRKAGWRFPQRSRSGPHKGELTWVPLKHYRVLQVLHNPRYAGAFVYRQHQSRKTVEDKSRIRRLAPDQWVIVLRQAHPGYIGWEEFEENQRRLRESAQVSKAARRSRPREGPALLQGIVVCGRCGDRMTVRYHERRDGLRPDYVCQRYGIQYAKSTCQVIPGHSVDEMVGAALVTAVTPVALEVALAVQQQLQAQLEAADRLRWAQVERARYEAELAQRRYLSVDPANRLVTATLEADWNRKLQGLAEAQEEYQRRRQADRAALSDEQRAKIFALASDFPQLWRDPRTPHRERKRMLRLLIEDVTLIKAEQITAHIRFKGGVAQTVTRPIPPQHWEKYVTPPETIAEIDRLLGDHTYSEIAAILDERGLKSGTGQSLTPDMISHLRYEHSLKSRYTRLREKGLLRLEEVAKVLAISTATVKQWYHHGLLRGVQYNDKNECLYENPGPDAPGKAQGVKFSRRLPNQSL